MCPAAILKERYQSTYLRLQSSPWSVLSTWSFTFKAITSYFVPTSNQCLSVLPPVRILKGTLYALNFFFTFLSSSFFSLFEWLTSSRNQCSYLALIMFVPEARVIAWSIGGTLKPVGAQIAVELDVSRPWMVWHRLIAMLIPFRFS
jgi:hypothetical protein